MNEISMSSDNISLKEILSGDGVGVIPGTSGGLGSAEDVVITIPHNYKDDHLLFRVMVRVPDSPLYQEWFVAPLTISDFSIVPYIDANNLYLELGQSGVSLPALNFQYFYRIFVP